MAQRDNMNNWIGKKMGNTFIGRNRELIAEKNMIGTFSKLFHLSMFGGRCAVSSDKYGTGQVQKEKQISAPGNSIDFKPMNL